VSRVLKPRGIERPLNVAEIPSGIVLLALGNNELGIRQLPYDGFNRLPDFAESPNTTMAIGDLVTALSLRMRPDEDRNLLAGSPNALDKFTDVLTVQTIRDR
jgi:hypothetical protein